MPDSSPLPQTSPIKLITTDILITDCSVVCTGEPVELEAALKELTEKYKPKEGTDKTAIDKGGYADFKKVFDQFPEGRITKSPGGSASNTLAAMVPILGPERVQAKFLGVMGKTDVPDDQVTDEVRNDRAIKDALVNANVELVPEKQPEGAISATSFIIRDPNGGRTIYTYPGNAKDYVTEEFVTRHLGDENNYTENDIFFIQASTIEKFSSGRDPESGRIHSKAINRLMDIRWKSGARLALALPTHAKFADSNKEDVKFMIPSADIVMGNMKELSLIYPGEDPVPALQKSMAGHAGLPWKEETKRTHDREPIAFITDGNNGVKLITKDTVTTIPCANLREGAKLFSLGAGDCSFAGFLSGMVLYPDDPEKAARMAMQLAGEKMYVNAARLPDPKATWNKITPIVEQEIAAEKKTKELAETLLPANTSLETAFPREEVGAGSYR